MKGHRRAVLVSRTLLSPAGLRHSPETLRAEEERHFGLDLVGVAVRQSWIRPLIPQSRLQKIDCTWPRFAMSGMQIGSSTFRPVRSGVN